MSQVEVHHPQSEDEGSHSTEEQEATDNSSSNYEKASLSVGRKTTYDTNHSRKTVRNVSPVAPGTRPVTADSSAASDDIARASWTTTSFAEMPNTLDELTNQNLSHHHHHHQDTKEARKTEGGNITSGPGTDIHALVMKHRGSASILTKYIRPNVSDEGTQAGIPSRDWLNSLEQLLIHFFLMVFESSSESNKLVMEMISSEAGQQIEEIFQLLLKAEPEMYKEMGNLISLAEKWLVHWKGNQEEKNKAVQYVKLYMQGVKDKNYYNLPVQVRLHKLGGFIAGLKVVGKPFHLPAVPPPEKARASKDNGNTSRLGSPRLKPAAHFSQVCANILCARPCDDPLPKAELYADKLAANLFKNPFHGDEEIKDYTDLKYGQYFQKKELFNGPRCFRNSIVDETGDADSQQESQQGPLDCSLNYHCWIPKYTKSYIENLQNRNCGKNGVFRQDGRESYNDPQSKGGCTGPQDKADHARLHMGCGGNNDYMGPNGRGGYYGPHGAGGYTGQYGPGGYPDPCGRGGYPSPHDKGGYPGPHDKGGYPCPYDKGGYPGPHGKGGYPCPHDKGGYPDPHGKGGYPCPHDKGGYPGPHGKGGYSGRNCKEGVLAHGMGAQNRSKKQKKLYEWVRGPDGKVHRRVVGSYNELGTSTSYHSGDFDREDARRRKFGKKGKGLRGRPPKAHSDTQLSSNGFNERKGNNKGGPGRNKSTKNKATEAEMAENATSGNKYTDKSKDLKQNAAGYQMDRRADDGSGDSRENDIEGLVGRKGKKGGKTLPSVQDENSKSKNKKNRGRDSADEDAEADDNMFRNMYGKTDGRDGPGGRRGNRGDGTGGRWGERGDGRGGRWGERGDRPGGRRGERGGGKYWRGKGAWNSDYEWEGEADDFTDFEGERNARYEQDKLHMLTLNACWEKAGKIFKKPSKALVVPPPENLMLHLEKKFPKSRWPHGQIVRQRLYPNGASFVEEYSNRSSKVFYPHGGLAVAVSGPSPITSQVLVVRDPSDQMFFFDKALIADLNSSGKGTIYGEDGTVKAQYSSLGGFKIEDADKARKWQWNQGGQRVQLKLNKYMSLRMSDHNRIFLNFNGNQRGFSVNVANGLRVKVMSSNTGNRRMDPIMQELKNLVRPKTAEDNFDLIRGEFRHPPRLGFIDGAKHYKHLLQEESMQDAKDSNPNGDLAPTDYALDSQFQNSDNAVRTSSSIIFRCSSGVKSCGQIRGSLSRSLVGRGFGSGSRSCSTTRFGGCDYGSNGYVIHSNELPTYCPSATCLPPYY